MNDPVRQAGFADVVRAGQLAGHRRDDEVPLAEPHRDRTRSRP
ncbi:MAG TPA: hypothetical protein VFC93_04150 [Chloroflexota bacterium]|nr:hypothetical protein [Chloroflexota bacterium]